MVRRTLTIRVPLSHSATRPPQAGCLALTLPRYRGDHGGGSPKLTHPNRRQTEGKPKAKMTIQLATGNWQLVPSTNNWPTTSIYLISPVLILNSPLHFYLYITFTPPSPSARPAPIALGATHARNRFTLRHYRQPYLISAAASSRDLHLNLPISRSTSISSIVYSQLQTGSGHLRPTTSSHRSCLRLFR